MICIHERFELVDPREKSPVGLCLQPEATKKEKGIRKEEKEKSKDGKDA